MKADIFWSNELKYVSQKKSLRVVIAKTLLDVISLVRLLHCQLIVSPLKTQTRMERMLAPSWAILGAQNDIF